MKLLKIVKSDNCKRKIEELSHFRLLLFTISFSFLIPFGFVFIYYLSTLYINFHSSDFFKTVLVLPIIIFVILYLPSVIVFLVLNLLNRIKINKKIELFFYLITGAVFGAILFREGEFIINGMHLLMYFLSACWGFLSSYILYKIIKLWENQRYAAELQITYC